MSDFDIHIPVPPLFSFRESLWFLDRNFDDCMHGVDGDSVRRVIPCTGKPVVVSLHEAPGGIGVRVLKGPGDAAVISSYVNEWLDVERNITPFYRLLAHDPQLAFMTKKFHGFHIVGLPDLFECLCWCILGQQINLDFAYRMKRRLVEKFGTAVRYGTETHYMFPQPEKLMDVKPDVLRAMQITTRKAEYIAGVARLMYDGGLSKESLLALGDETAMLRALVSIRGIGEWTGNYALMKCLRMMNCVPWGDAGINIALNDLKGIPKKNNRAFLEPLFEEFDGWKTYLVFYLWRSRREPGGTEI